VPSRLQYLDGINDLLGRESFDKAKHEIKHEKNRTIVSDAVVGEWHLSNVPPRAVTLMSYFVVQQCRLGPQPKSLPSSRRPRSAVKWPQHS